MTYTLTVEQNELTDEYYVLLPQELLNKVGWVEGDEIIWKHQKDGSFILKKKGSKK
jgi:bifunctional DNA-binding transcriptional regulator/antitoxin component of YhaV-PrlF toxin-antitoxin module